MSAEESNAESKYEVREIIGKGAFGEVNLVVDKQSKQRFVLKRIKMARQSEWQRKATRQEIEIVSRLRHPFVMPYKEHWTHHGHTINVVYGYCEKGDLTSAITKQKGKYFAEETLRLWLAELLLAVDYMHRQNVLHRDIKTQNILLTGDGDVQIGDFGLSTVRVPSTGDVGPQHQQQPDGDDTDPRLDLSPSHFEFDVAGVAAAAGSGGSAATPEPAKGHHAVATAHVPANPAGAEAYTSGLANAHANGLNGHPAGGDKDKDQLAGNTPVHDLKAGTRNDYALVGTPHFMSPELLSSQKYSYETDIWSLGVVMYELTTLKPPFNAFNLAGLVAKIKRAALPPIPPCYSPEWTAILKSMLRKDPTRRAAPLELLSIPSLQQALQQARQRALVISPSFVMPEIPIFDASCSPSFCFDVAAPAPAGGAGAGGGAAGAGGTAVLQRTPSAAGPSTPVLINPLAISGDEVGGAEVENSPLSKFPDLAAAVSPMPAQPVPSAAAAPAAAPPPPPPTAATTAEATRSKTPATARRPSGTGGPAVGPAGAAATATATAAVVAKRPMSPQRARAAPVFGGAQRSKTPGRAFVGAAAAKADADGNGRGVRKGPTTARESRSRSVLNTAVSTSPRGLSGCSASAAGQEVAALASARASSPTEAAERPPGRKAGPNSGPAPRVAALAAFRPGNARRSLLDAVGQQQQQQHAPVAAAAAAVMSVSVQATHDGESGEAAASPGPRDTAAAPKLTSPPSTGGHKSLVSPGAVAAPHAAAAGVGRMAPWRARSASVNTARTSRAALAAGSSPPQASPRAADAAAGNGHHPTAGTKRHVSVARGGSIDSTGATATVTTMPKRASAITATADGAKRLGQAAEAGSVRPRNTSPTQHRTSAVTAATAAAAAHPAVLAPRRRSQPGTAMAAAATVAADAGATRPPEKRVRRSSYVSYGKPADSAPLQRRPLTSSSHAHASVLTSRDSAPAAAAAAGSASTKTVGAAATARELSIVSSHPLAVSDLAVDNSSASAGCSPIGKAGSSSHAALASPKGSSDAQLLVPGAAVKGVLKQEPVEQPMPPSARDRAAVAPAANSAELSSSARDRAAAATGVGEAPEPAAAVGAGNVASGAGHPWRLAPRSRSLMSMTTEDSELSLPDGRYGPSETNGGGVYDVDAGVTAFPTAASSPPGIISGSVVVNPIAMPHWSCNQLFSGSYGSCAGSLTDIAAQAAMVAPSATVAAAAPPPPGGAVGGRGSARGTEAIVSTGGAVTLAADLPRRVSAAVFEPHLLASYGHAATAAAAAEETDSEASTPAEPPRGSARAGLQMLTLNESFASGEAGGGGERGRQLVSPGRFDLVSSSPAAAGAGVDSPSGLSSSATSPLSGLYGGRGGMEIVSPTAAAVPLTRRHAPAASGGDSPVGQYRRGGSSNSLNAQQLQQRRSNRALDARTSGGIGGALSSRQSGEASFYEASPLGSTASAVQRTPAQQHQHQTVAAPVDSGSEVTSQLRPVAEDVDGEAESAPPQQQQHQSGLARGAVSGPGLYGIGGGAASVSELSASERAQLALLQRVVALAGSLWEMGRDEEMGAVLSSTLSRALVRRPGAAATPAPAAFEAAVAKSSGMSEPHASLSASASGSVRPRAPEPGDLVHVTAAGPLRGTQAVVRYRGPCHWGAGTVLGLELPHAVAPPGGHTANPAADELGPPPPPGCRDGVRYFRCHKAGSGAAFVEVEQVDIVQ